MVNGRFFKQAGAGGRLTARRAPSGPPDDRRFHRVRLQRLKRLLLAPIAAAALFASEPGGRPLTIVRPPLSFRSTGRADANAQAGARAQAASNSGVIVISGTSTSPLSVMRISGITESGIRLKPM